MKCYILLLPLLLISGLYPSSGLDLLMVSANHTYDNQESVKDHALTVLREKCNVCHATKKRTDIFTLENMDSLAETIQKQVFIKKKMPKGRKVTLTSEELQALEEWVTAVLDTPKNTD